MNLDALPHLNAAFNATGTVFLLAAYGQVRRGHYRAHGWLMAGALLCSALFLGGYLTWHFAHPPRSFGVQGTAVRSVYFTILLTHSILAVVILPMIVMMLYRAWRRRWPQHRRLGRWTLPLWLYVSVTGVVVYWMLYWV
jgi:uncharacterized membrane protein YozB (DUF420 family)